jgi:hypothetical protein
VQAAIGNPNFSLIGKAKQFQKIEVRHLRGFETMPVKMIRPRRGRFRKHCCAKVKLENAMNAVPVAVVEIQWGYGALGQPFSRGFVFNSDRGGEDILIGVEEQGAVAERQLNQSAIG